MSYRSLSVHLCVDVSQAAHDACQLGIKGSPYSTAERRVPELIPVLGSQPALGYRATANLVLIDENGYDDSGGHY